MTTAMSGQHNHDRRRRGIRLAILFALLALAFYGGFILMQSLR
jgi:hypothetical protein